MMKRKNSEVDYCGNIKKTKIDDEIFDPRRLAIIMAQAKCCKIIAIEALNINDYDIIKSILWIRELYTQQLDDATINFVVDKHHILKN